MSFFRTNLAAAGIVAMTALPGCEPNKPTPVPVSGEAPSMQVTISSPPPPMKQIWTSGSLAVPPTEAKPVHVASLPLVYLVQAANVLRVVDQTNGAELLKMPVIKGTLVAIDERGGIRLGREIVRAGALPADHRYAIYLDNTEPNMVRQGSQTPGGLP